jgi:IS5 family transposase
MRKAFDQEPRLDRCNVADVEFDLESRDEIVPILKALQHVCLTPSLRDAVLDRVAGDVFQDVRDDIGREGMDLWHLLVLGTLRLGCNFDYDRLADLATNHRTVRGVMGLGEWDGTRFTWRRVRDNVCLLSPETISRISDLIVAAGEELSPGASHRVRADSFVVETNIHYPTESRLIEDGIRTVMSVCVDLADAFELSGWRQHGHLFQQIRRQARDIGRIASKKGPGYQKRLKTGYRKLLKRSGIILEKARELITAVLGQNDVDIEKHLQLSTLQTFIDRTEQVRSTARRRVLEGETVPNNDKLFSIFEAHTQLYRRGKTAEPNQFGRLVLVFENSAGFLVHHHVPPRDVGDADMVVEQTRALQKKLGGVVAELSLDRGFHSPENQTELSQLVPHLCLPKPGAKQAASQDSAESEIFYESKRRHSGVESAIGALQSGNGQERCRDRTEPGFERYVALGILGRNLHVLGRLLIARENAACEAARTRRAA